MAFPAIQDADTKSGSPGNSSSWTLTYPTNLASGDLILAICGEANSRTATFPAGWVVFSKTVSGRGLIIAKKLSDGTETGNFTVTWSGTTTASGWFCIRVTGWEGTLGTTFDNTANAGSVCVASITGSAANADPPSLDPNNWAAEDTLWLATGASALATGYPTNYTDGAGVTVVEYARRNLNASSEDPGAFTTASGNWVAGTVAIRPTAGTTITATSATASAAAGTPTIAEVVLGATSTASAAAGTPVLAETILFTVASASASAPIPTVVNPNVTITADVATASAAAGIITPAEIVFGEIGTASAAAGIPTPVETILATAGTASAAAGVPLFLEVVLFTVASASAAAGTPTLVYSSSIVAAVATAAAAAGVPTILTLLLSPAVCTTLTITAATCTTLTLTAGSTTALGLSAAADNALGISAAADAALTLTGSTPRT